MPPPSGGMATQTLQLAKLLGDERIKVELVQVNVSYRPNWVAYVPALRALFRLIPYLARLWHAAGRNDVAHIMANSGWSWHLFAAPAILIARLRGLRVVVNYRGGKADAFLQRQGRLVLPVLKRADALVVPSGFLAKIFGSYGLQTIIVPNIVDLGRFSESDASCGDLAAGPHIIVTRNLEAIYDISTALHAFAAIRAYRPSARMSVAGSGPEEERLVKEARELNLNEAIRFTGSLDREGMARLYRSAHIMLNPSLVDNTPNSILEAWASGVIVVSTNVGGVPFLVADGVDAITVPPREPRAMAKAVVAILDAPQTQESMRTAGKRSASRFTWDQIRPLWLDAYRDERGG